MRRVRSNDVSLPYWRPGPIDFLRAVERVAVEAARAPGTDAPSLALSCVSV